MGALRTFPAETGLGWDAMHPRSVLRQPKGILLEVMQLLSLCEAVGRWPDIVQMVVIVLLAQADGGLCPIGLIQALPRIWMRARRSIAREWGELQSRTYLFAGVAMPRPLLGNKLQGPNSPGLWGKVTGRHF